MGLDIDIFRWVCWFGGEVFPHAVDEDNGDGDKGCEDDLGVGHGNE